MRGHPAPHNARQGLHKLRRANFCGRWRDLISARLALAFAQRRFKRCRCFSFGGFLSCLLFLLCLLVLVRLLRLLFLALPRLFPGLFPALVPLVRRLCLCVLRRGLFLAGLWWRFSRPVLLLARLLGVLLLLLLVRASRLVSRSWWFAVGGSGGVPLSLCLLPGGLFLPPLVPSSLLLSLGADSFLLVCFLRWGFAPFFLLIGDRYLIFSKKWRKGESNKIA